MGLQFCFCEAERDGVVNPKGGWHEDSLCICNSLNFFFSSVLVSLFFISFQQTAESVNQSVNVSSLLLLLSPPPPSPPPHFSSFLSSSRRMHPTHHPSPLPPQHHPHPGPHIIPPPPQPPFLPPFSSSSLDAKPPYVHPSCP